MKRILIEIGFCATVVIAAVVTVFVYKYKAESAEEEARTAEKEVERVEDMWTQAEQDKRELEAMLVVYDRAFTHAKEKTRVAVREYMERNAKIDESDSDWCVDDLPTSVRDAFSGYVCDGTSDISTGGIAGAVRTTDGAEAGNK